MKEWLKEGFAYDRWANEIWLRTLEDHGIDFTPFERFIGLPTMYPDFSAEPRRRIADVFCHILFAQQIWLGRCVPDTGPAEGSAAERLLVLNEAWSRAVDSIEPETVIAYRNTSGAPFEMPFGDIARHVIDHGTYHRGQIRELFDAIAPGGKPPETGFIGFAMIREAAKAAGTL